MPQPITAHVFMERAVFNFNAEVRSFVYVCVIVVFCLYEEKIRLLACQGLGDAVCHSSEAQNPHFAVKLTKLI